MRRFSLSVVFAVLVCVSIGCLAVVSEKTLAASTKRVEVVDGEMYVIDLSTNTATKVRLVEDEETMIEVTSASATKGTVSQAHP